MVLFCFLFFLYLKFSRKSIFISVHFVPKVDTLECPYLWHAVRRSYSNFDMCIFRLPNMVTWYEGEEQCQHFVGQPLARNETLIDANKEGSIFNINETGQYTYFRKHFPVLSSFMIYYRLVNIVKGLVPLVVEADEGDYACQATNIAESASSSNSRLIVNGGKLI